MPIPKLPKDKPLAQPSPLQDPKKDVPQEAPPPHAQEKIEKQDITSVEGVYEENDSRVNLGRDSRTELHCTVIKNNIDQKNYITQLFNYTRIVATIKKIELYV